MQNQNKFLLSHYRTRTKASKQQFLQQLKQARQQIQRKLKTNQNNTNSLTYLDHILSAKQKNNQNDQNTHSQIKQRFKTYTDQSTDAQYNKGYLQRATQADIFYLPPQLNKSKQSIRILDVQRRIRIKKMKYSQNSVRERSLPTKFTRNLDQNQANLQVSSYFESFFLKIPAKRQKRVTSQLLPALQYLQCYNRLFNKMDQNLGVCLLKIGIYHELQPNDLLYSRGFDKKSVFIILQGAIVLSNSIVGIKKIFFTGQTLGQQMLYGNSPVRSLLETAKAVVKSYVLEIKIKDYIVMCTQTKKYGFSKALEQLQEQLRDGYATKNVSRNQHLFSNKSRVKY